MKALTKHINNLICLLWAAVAAHALPQETVAKVLSEISDLGRASTTRAQIEAIKTYVQQSSSESMARGVELLLHPGLRSLRREINRAGARITIDGSSRDWKNSSFLIQDDRNDPHPINEQEPMLRFSQSDDLVTYGCLADTKYLYCVFRTASLPKRNQQYHYRINLLTASAKLIYAIVWSSWGNVIQEWNPSTGTFRRNISTKGAKFARGTVFEAKVPLRLLPKLPPRPRLEAATWNEQKNLFDSHYSREGLAKLLKYRNYALALLCQYAARRQLEPDDPFPLAQAIVDAFPYSIADATTQAQIIEDGLTMIDQREISSTITFNGQKKLSELPFEQLLTWSDRSLMYGSDDMNWKLRNTFASNGGLLNLEAYRFLFLQPGTLQKARDLVTAHDLLVPGDLAATSRAIEAWLQAVWKYRSDGGVIEDACAHMPGYWCDVLKEYQDEVARGDIILTLIGEDPIFKWRSLSASFHINYLAEHGLYYGNCIDTTVIALALGKALGLPVIHIHYDTIVNGIQLPVHSFPAFFSSAANRYVPFSAGFNGIPEWKLSGDSSDRVYYYLEMPVTSMRFQRDVGRAAGAQWSYSSNQCAQTIAPENWSTIDREGVASAAVNECLRSRLDA